MITKEYLKERFNSFTNLAKSFGDKYFEIIHQEMYMYSLYLAGADSKISKKELDLIKEVTRCQVKDPEAIYNKLRKVSSKNSMADVFRVLLQFADKTQFIKFNEIELAYKNKVKFKLNGDYFHELGEGYSYQNPIYTIQHFPENLLNIDGSSSYETWTGGWIAVGAQQMEDANDFHKRWYLDDILK